MDIILSFLAKPVNKHGITQVHVAYPPLAVSTQNVLHIFDMFAAKQKKINTLINTDKHPV